ncbi:MAG TPA: hypothetical protein VKO18_08915 [Terriglobia bacterium]|nr:hypothetical protein [Terriglobia bacterium]
MPSTISSNFMCDDYQDEIYIPENWKVNTYNIENLAGGASPFVTFGDNSDSLYDRLGVGTQLQAYAEALYIAQGLLNSPSTPDPQASVDSFAIWTLMNNTVPAPGDISSSVSSLLASTGTWWTNTCDPNQSAQSTCLAGLSDVNIYVPVPGSQSVGNQPQEFLGLDPGGDEQYRPFKSPDGPVGTVAPEPVSMVLMGTFLSLAGGLLSRKKRAL